jgi:YD repeat-containing protein
MRPYSLDLRTRIVAALDTGQPVAAVAERFAVSARTVRRYRQQWHTAGQLRARTAPGRRRVIPPEQDALLRAQVAAHPDATLAVHCQLWTEATGQQPSLATMCRALQRLRWTHKKSTSSPTSTTRSSGPPGGT